MSYALLLTASINPSAKNIDLKRADPSLRLKDYEKALTYWLCYKESLITGIVFIDNSGFNIASLKKIVDAKNLYNREIEFITDIKPTALADGIHYGYSELEMMDAAFNTSKIIEKTQYIIKATGRLYFPKLTRLIKFNERHGYDMIADSRDFNLLGREKHYVLTTLFISSKNFYNTVLKDKRLLMRDLNVSHIETLYFKILANNHSNCLLRFPFNVEPVGIGAHWNKDYTSLQYRAIALIRGLTRKVAPKIRI